MAAEQKLINVRASIDNSIALKGVKNRVHVYFEITTGKLQEVSRPPVDLCIVLDCSVSMSSHRKMETAKEAIKGVVCSLEAGDRVSLVVYSAFSKIVFGFDAHDLGDGSDIICSTIDGIHIRNGTNLGSGLMSGLQTFEECKALTDQTSRNKRIFLFSDGLVNKGMVIPSKICDVASKAVDAGITVDSFGIGEDFNEDLMQNIAEYGCGQFLFIEESEAMEQFVSFALKGVLRLVASRAVLKVQGAGSSIVEKVYGGDCITGFSLGGLIASNCRGVLVEVSCSPCGEAERADLAKWELSYQNTKGEEEKMTGVLDLTVTEDAEEVANNPHPNVSVTVALYIRHVVKIDKKVDYMIAGGRRGDAVALKEKFLRDLNSMLDLDPENVKLLSFIQSQKRAIQELKDITSSMEKNIKINKKSRYAQMFDSADYCKNDKVWEANKTI